MGHGWDFKNRWITIFFPFWVPWTCVSMHLVNQFLWIPREHIRILNFLMLLCNIFLLKVKWIKFMWCWVFHSFMFLILNLLQWKCIVLDFIKIEGSRMHILYSSRGFKAQGNCKSSCRPFSSDNYFVLLLHSYWCNIHGTHAWKIVCEQNNYTTNFNSEAIYVMTLWSRSGLL